jgi:predicted amidohydrolase
MKVALHQFSSDPEMHENLSTVIAAMEAAAAAGADLYMTPEVCLSPFFPQYPGKDVQGYALTLESKEVESLCAACCRLSIASSPNIYLQLDGACYVASLMIDRQGELTGISKMVHIVQAPRFFEQDYYTPSDSGFHVYHSDAGQLGVVICFYHHLPESIRTCALKGAEIVLIPAANSLGEPAELFEWELRVAAMQNGLFIACCNRVGIEDEMEFYGDSLIIDPWGDIVAKAGSAADLLVVDIDLAKVGEARAERPYLKLRRSECYTQR